jgi:hypothetical protein
MRLALALLLVLYSGPAFADFHGLLAAARRGDVEALRQMLAEGEHPNPPTIIGVTPRCSSPPATGTSK